MNALDKAGISDIGSLLRFWAEEGKTILLATHLQSDIDSLCDELYEVSDGKLFQRKEAIHE